MIIENVNPLKLNDELLASGVNVVLMTFEGNTAYVIFGEEADMGKVNEVVSKHNPAPIPKPKTEVELLQERIELMQEALDELILGGGL